MAQLEAVLAEHLKSNVPFVQGVVDYVVANGGKRIRPILTLLSAKLSGYQGDAALKLGCSLEFMHTATLLHDDVIDNADLRRGRLSTNSKWGNQVGVLVGDFFYCRAMDILVAQGNFKILKVVTDAISVTTEGEIFEVTKSNDPSATEAEYMKIITDKTAVLMAAACQVGGILAQVSDDFEQSLRRFGLNLGIAFQLMDDMLDYTSPTEEFGKTNGTDLREGKLTLPLIIALKKCNTAEAQLIRQTIIADEIPAENFKPVLEIINRYDGVRETQAMAKSYIQKAQDALSIFKPSLERETLQTIADFVIHRRF